MGVSDGKGGKGLGDQVAEDLMLSRVCFARCVLLPIALAVGFGLVCFTRAIKSSYVCRVNSKVRTGLVGLPSHGLGHGLRGGRGHGNARHHGLGAILVVQNGKHVGAGESHGVRFWCAFCYGALVPCTERALP